MSLQVEKLENNMAKLTIEVPADDLEKALQSAYMKQKNKIAMPGFRKGKVPRQMIEKMYGPEIFYDDAANALIPKAYSEAYEECELEIVSRPEINVVQIEKGKSFLHQVMLYAGYCGLILIALILIAFILKLIFPQTEWLLRQN